MLDVRLVRSRSCHVLWLTVLTAALVLGCATTAMAGTITNWRSYGPTGIVGTNVPVLVDATGPTSPDPLVSSSLKLLVDGVLVPRSSYTSSVLARSIYVYYIPSPVLTDGPHTFRVEVSDTVGRLSAKQWSATIAQSPSASWVSPASGAVIYNGRPSIIMSLSDNTPGTTYTITGQVRTGTASGPVVATFGMSTASPSTAFTLDAELAPGSYYLTAIVSDAAGNIAALQGATAQGFTCGTAAAMTILNECDSCHPAESTAHPTPDNGNASCVACHVGYDGQHMAPEPNCDNCHDAWHTNGAKTTVAISASCLSCHSPSRPDLPRHTAASVGPQHGSGCGGCHAESLIARHATTPAGSAYPYQCGLCHSSKNADVIEAITAGNSACDACHKSGYHLDFDVSHEAPTDACGGSGCHATTLLVDAHEPYVGPGNRHPEYEDTCSLCHSNEEPDRVPADATADCATCHPDRVVYHGFSEEAHTAADSRLAAGTVVSPATGDEKLYYTKDYVYPSQQCSACHALQIAAEHAKASSTSSSAGCASCHPTARATFETWGDSCTQGGCHPDSPANTHGSTMTARHRANLPTTNNTCGDTRCHALDLVTEHTRLVISSPTPTTKPRPTVPLVTGGPLTCVGCHSSDEFRALEGPWNGECTACHAEFHGDSSALTQVVRDKHQSWCVEHEQYHNVLDLHAVKSCTTTGCHTGKHVYPGYPLGRRGFGYVTDPAVTDVADCQNMICHALPLPDHTP